MPAGLPREVRANAALPPGELVIFLRLCNESRATKEDSKCWKWLNETRCGIGMGG